MSRERTSRGLLNGVMVKVLVVFGLGAIELWAAIPAGLGLGLDPVAAGLTATLGALAGLLVIVLAGERVRTWLLRRRGGKTRHGLVYRVWQSYGVVGLGLLAPLLIGAPLGAALGLTLGAQAGRLLLWLSLGILLWGLILTLAVALGWAGVQALVP